MFLKHFCHATLNYKVGQSRILCVLLNFIPFRKYVWTDLLPLKCKYIFISIHYYIPYKLCHSAHSGSRSFWCSPCEQLSLLSPSLVLEWVGGKPSFLRNVDITGELLHWLPCAVILNFLNKNKYVSIICYILCIIKFACMNQRLITVNASLCFWCKLECFSFPTLLSSIIKGVFNLTLKSPMTFTWIQS